MKRVADKSKQSKPMFFFLQSSHKITPGYTIECSEKYKSFKLKIPQPDSKREVHKMRKSPI